MNKLHRKDFSISVKKGTDANKSKFAKEAVLGEMYYATDTGSLYVANNNAGSSDALLTKYEQSGVVQPSALPDNYSLSFDGTDDSFSTSTYNPLFSGAFTLSAWYKTPSTFPQGSPLYGYSLDIFGISGDSSAGTGAVEIRINSLNNSTDAKIQLYYSPAQTTSNDSNMYGAQTGVILSPDTWYHICWVADRNSSSATSYLYVDGSSVTLSAQSGYVNTLHNTSTAFNNTGNLTIGARSDGNLYALGLINDVAIFNTALSASDVTLIYNNGNAGRNLSSLNPVGWWRMEEGTGTTVIDQGSGGNDGTLNGPTFSTDTP